MVVIEMNPRVSRSSALASKATGFPDRQDRRQARRRLHARRDRNDITRETPASFEPTIDYVVVKVPRFTFEKFPGADPTLTTQMKSVGEAMAIGRTFKDARSRSNVSACAATATTSALDPEDAAPETRESRMPSEFSSSRRRSRTACRSTKFSS
jgi:carbamoyl-phosphate synthase large subunit